ncbi:TonB-dependent receptor [Bacteroidota bacterium]
MKKLSGSLLLLLFLPFISSAQFTLSGKVINDNTLEPLVGCHVRINSETGMLTNANGEFEFNKLEAGIYTLKISYIGYKTFENTINLKKDNYFTIKMEESSIRLEEIHIEATKAQENSPITYQNLKKKDIQAINLGRDLPYLLDQTPSLVTTSDAGTGVGYTGLWIRGTDIQRINVTINGIPLNDAESHGVYFVDLPDMASSVDNIQIQRGVGTSTNGSAAFGGSINIETNSLQEKSYAETSHSFGSFNTRKHSISAGTGLINNKWTIDTRLSKVHSDGFVDRAYSDLTSYFISGAYYGNKSLIKLVMFSGLEETYQAWYGIPKNFLETNRTFNPYTYENEIDHYQQTHFQLHYAQRLTERLDLNAAIHYTRGLGYYEQYKNDRNFYDYGLENIHINDTVLWVGSTPYIFPDSTIRSSDLVQRKWLDNHFYGFTSSLRYERNKLKTILGVSWNQYRGDHYGQIIWAQFASNGLKDHQWYFNNGIKDDLNSFLKINYLITGKIFLYGDLQFRKIAYSIEGTHDDLRDLSMQKDYLFLNPKAGISYKIKSNEHLYFSWAVANREPNRTNFRDADPGKIPLPERLNDYELGYRIRRTKIQLEVNGYYMFYKNQLVLTGEINNVGAPIMNNVAKSFRRGVEIVSTLNLAKKINWKANFTLSQNRIIGFTEFVDNWSYWDDPVNEEYQLTSLLGTTDIAFSPAIIAGSQISWHPIKKMEVSLQSKYVGKQFIDNTSNNDRSIDPYVVNNLRFSYEFSIKDVRQFILNLQINNIFNEMYETNAWVYRYYYSGDYYEDYGYFPQAGINFLTGLTIGL